MLITKDWIHAHKTPAGGWNRKQMTAIGVRWPQPKGWMNEAVGKELCEINRLRFESHSKSPPAKESLEDRLSKLEAKLRRFESIYPIEHL